MDKSYVDIILTEFLEWLLPLVGVFVGAAVTKLRSFYKNYNYKKTHSNQFSINVQNRIVELRSLLAADRSFILLRHNGTQLVNGKGYDRVSMVYESTANWARVIKDEFQGVPIHMFGEFIGKCDNNLQYVVDEDLLSGDSVDHSDMHVLLGMMKNFGIDISIMVPIRQSHMQIPDGYIGVHFKSNQEVQANTDDIIDMLKEYSRDVGYILSH